MGFTMTFLGRGGGMIVAIYARKSTDQG